MRKPTGIQSAVLALSAGLLLLAGCASAPKAEDAPIAAPAAAAAEPEPVERGAVAAAEASGVEELSEIWGVQIVGLRWTSGGYMLDFRFRVLDAQKASPLFVRQTKPYLVDVRTGARFMVPNPPKTGPLRTSDPPKEGVIYWMFFANPGQYLKPGDPATVVIGDFRAENLVVE